MFSCYEKFQEEINKDRSLTPEHPAGSRRDRTDYYIIDKTTELGQLIDMYHNAAPEYRARILGYASAFADKV